ncbi:3-oxoacyl-[acyl-carrier-protein] reductase FabG [Leucoagaricus sp. SymC.cos]|nr:3-oxoacyl-[acyl-carrier-protein] reductase FabG [Leucoagaricus sp. SymC.cos]
MAMSRRVIIWHADVIRADDVKGMVEDVVGMLGGLDVMVTSAGILIPKPFLGTSLEEWDTMFNVNAKGVYPCYNYAGMQMIKQGRRGCPLMLLYSATNFTGRSLTQSAAAELGKHGITVNAYAPSTTASRRFDLSNVLTPTPIQDAIYDNIGNREEIAALVLYLVSDAARHVNGNIQLFIWESLTGSSNRSRAKCKEFLSSLIIEPFLINGMRRSTLTAAGFMIRYSPDKLFVLSIIPSNNM